MTCRSRLSLRLVAAGLLAAAAVAMPAAPADAQGRPERGFGRQQADHDYARDRQRQGDFRAFADLLDTAQRVAGPSQFLGSEPDIGRGSYRFKFLRADGRVLWIDVDGRSGRVLAVR